MSLDQSEHIYYTLLSTIDGSAHLTIVSVRLCNNNNNNNNFKVTAKQDTKLVYENPLFVGQGTPSSFELVN
jgi:hypothetical protein